jgi:ankyrin repeat protein
MSLHYAVQQNDLNSLSSLLNQGVEPDIAINNSRGTPLHDAVTLDRLAAAAILLAHGANPNALEYEFYTPLHSARSVKMVALLLRYNADMTIKNKFGRTPLSVAAMFSSEMVKLLLEGKADPNEVDNNGNTPLKTGVECGGLETTKLLLLHKANVNVANKMCKTALFEAITRQNAPLVNLLLEHQASVNVSDFSGTTPLHEAVDYCPQVVKTLLMHGAIVQVYNKARETPMTLLRFKSPLKPVMAKFEWQQTLMEFCKGLHPRLGQDSSVRRCWTSDLSERNLIWLIGLFLKPSAE